VQRILIVDDIQEDVQELNKLLRDHYEIFVADSCTMAAQLMGDKNPDLLLMNVMLADMESFMISGGLKDRLEDCQAPIIFIVDRNNPDGLVKAFAWGGDYVGKPFIAEELLVRVQVQLELCQVRETLRERNFQLSDVLEEIDSMARIDLLTNVPNRPYMLERVKDEAARAFRYQRPLTFVIANVDNLTAINKDFGQDCGNYILQCTADIIRTKRRGHDVVARWGGDVFLLMLPETDLSDGGRVAERIRVRVESAKIGYSGKDIPVTLTMGVAEFTADWGADTTIKKAEEAMRKGKTMTKNCVVLADGSWPA